MRLELPWATAPPYTNYRETFKKRLKQPLKPTNSKIKPHISKFTTTTSWLSFILKRQPGKKPKYATEAVENENIGNYPRKGNNLQDPLQETKNKNRKYGQASTGSKNSNNCLIQFATKKPNPDCGFGSGLAENRKKGTADETWHRKRTENQRLDRDDFAGFSYYHYCDDFISLQIRIKQAPAIQKRFTAASTPSQMNPHFYFNELGRYRIFYRKRQQKFGKITWPRFASPYPCNTRIFIQRIHFTYQRKTNADSYIEAGKKCETREIRLYVIQKTPWTRLYQHSSYEDPAFIENAIKHGFSYIHYPGVLTVTITR